MNEFLFRMARSFFGRWAIRWIFAHTNFIIPVRRLRETPTLIAFYHPRPSYPFHILLVPTKALADLGPQDSAFLAELFQAVQSLVAEFELEQAGYRLIVNGGPYQDVPLLHFFWRISLKIWVDKDLDKRTILDYYLI